jgi:hypothetical protein
MRRVSNHEAPNGAAAPFETRTRKCVRAPQGEAETGTAPAKWFNSSGTRASLRSRPNRNGHAV